MGKRTSFQQRAIKNYYDNREAISVQRLQELVTELYLSEGKKRERQWGMIVTHLEKLKVKKSRIEHLREKDDPALVAELVKQLFEQNT